jgi:HAD superfamily hydrolase (TIGR01662 family)
MANEHAPEKGYKLVVFDVDGTLAETYKTKLLPGVGGWFERRPAEPGVAIATNQGGVGLRYWMEHEGFGNPKAYPTRDRIIYRMRVLARLLRVPWKYVYVAFAYRNKKGEAGPVPPEFAEDPYWRHDWRKPEAGMIRQAMADQGVTASETLMVGDREDDRGAAELAGVAFMWADVFFGRRQAGEEVEPLDGEGEGQAPAGDERGGP